MQKRKKLRLKQKSGNSASISRDVKQNAVGEPKNS